MQNPGATSITGCYGRSARGSPEPSPAAPRQPERSGVFREGLPNCRVLASRRLPRFQQQAALSLPCLGIYHWLRTIRLLRLRAKTAPLVRPSHPHPSAKIHHYSAATSGHQFPLVRPRASRPPLYSWLRSLVNRLIAHASLRLRFMIERRFRHTSTRGSVAERRTSNRRFTGDCIHPSLLRRGATEPPDSHSPLYTFYMFYTAKTLCALCASALNIPPIHYFLNQSLQTLLFSNETHKNFRISLLITL